MSTLIIGASGLVGSHCLQVAKRAGRVSLGTHRNFASDGTVPLDLTQEMDWSAPIDGEDQEVVDTVVMCAALTHVDLCEREEERSYLETVTSARNAAVFAQARRARLVYISTDYVFDGDDGPYHEDDRVNPINVYGRHKLEAERIIQDSVDYGLVLRVTGVYGDEARDKNFVSRLIADRSKRTLEVPGDQWATPVNAELIAEACFGLLRADRTGVFNVSSTDYMSRYQLARRVVDAMQARQITIAKTNTGDLAQAARRPLRGGLLNHKLQDALPALRMLNLDDYLRDRTPSEGFRQSDHINPSGPSGQAAY